jgi:membrane protein DedA with SNARE-associated domain
LVIENLLSFLASFIIQVIEKTGYLGIGGLMVLESANLPIPSEIIMPFSGYLVFAGKFSFLLVVLAGATGNLLGSILGYLIGYFGGRPFVEKYGNYFLISRKDLERTDAWFAKYGQGIVFFSRMLPIIRTFISTPAGIVRMNFKKFCLFTFLGSLPWSVFLTFVGLKAGENWQILEGYFRKFDWLIIIIVLIIIIWWVWKHKLSKIKNL